MRTADITKQPYSEWLEKALRDVVKLNPDDICIACMSKGGDSCYVNVFSGYTLNKLMFAGMIQQDAMLDTLEANGYINETNEETENGEEEN